eukprot:2319762-Alexandrium_andersonii.AAC.1
MTVQVFWAQRPCVSVLPKSAPFLPVSTKPRATAEIAAWAAIRVRARVGASAWPGPGPECRSRKRARA